MKKKKIDFAELIFGIDILVLFLSICCLDSGSWIAIISTFVSIGVFVYIGIKERIFG